SRGVIRADDSRAFVAGVERVRQLMKAAGVRGGREQAHEALLVESFIAGQEFAGEGVITEGVFQAFAIFDKPDPLDGPFFEETLYITPSRASQEVQRKILEGVSAAASAIGLRHGPLHAECRVNESGVFVLEVAARPI